MTLEVNINDPLGKLIGISAHLIMKNMDFQFSKAGLPITGEQFKLMSALWGKDGISQQEIADKINRNRSAACRMLNILEIQGLIKRVQHPIDKRQKLIFLTVSGKRIKNYVCQVLDNTINVNIKEGLTETDALILKKKLIIIISNLNKLSQ